MELNQHQLYENARSRIKQKKRLYYHFILFLVGSVFLIILNKVLNVGDTYNWFVWAITFWAFLFILHLVNVFLINPFMGKDWERKQTEKLIALQQKKIVKMKKKFDNEMKHKEDSETYAEELKNQQKPKQD